MKKENIIFLIFTLCLFNCKKEALISIEPEPEICQPPFNFSVEKASNLSIKLSWEDSCSITEGYILERKEKGGTYSEIKQFDKEKRLYLDLVYDLDAKVYTYRIKSFTSAKESEYAVELSTPDIIIQEGIYPHLIYHPKDYDSHPDSNFALLFFLHGAGERGPDLSMVDVHGPPYQIKKGMEFPAIVVSPQVSTNQFWESNRLQITLDSILANNRVETDKIYVTGLSMGGFGTWDWAIAYPDNFAAIIPICGGGDPTKVASIKDLPNWVFHGELDNVVPLSASQNMVNALKEIGGNPMFTIYPNVGHNCWTETYDNPGVYEWLFSQ